MKKLHSLKKGFTLIELLAVITLLGIMALFVVPKISDTLLDTRTDLYNKQISLIISAARLWASDEENKLILANNTAWPYEITLGDLQDSEYLGQEIKNPKTDDYFHENTIIQIDKINNSYRYSVMDTIDATAPVVTLKGQRIQNIEIKTSYQELGASAQASNGNTLGTTISFRKNGAVVDKIDTNTLGTYKVIYTAKDGEKSSSVARTVHVVDTTAPVLTCSTCPANHIITLKKTTNYTLPTVTATDNSGEAITVLQTGSFSSSTVGESSIVYTASDSSGNRATLKITFQVTE